MFPQIFGKYVLEREIAAGGMARVYLATLRGAVGFEKRLVVKQIRTELASDEAFVNRFVDEAKMAVELSHPNIVPVYELGVEQGVYYIAMELCEGLTLSEVLAETGPLDPAEGAYVGAEICRALDYAHRRAQIVHRDVTPRNVLIDDEGAVRLIDFGIAAPVTRVDDPARTEVFGSPGHMPPEQLHGAELTPATDVFAVGALLIEAWTGSPPFRRATPQESERALFQVPAPMADQCPELSPLSAVVAASVALDARERPAAAELLARPLREFLKTEDSGDIARRLGERVGRARQRSRSSGTWLPAERAASSEQLQTRALHGELAPGVGSTGESSEDAPFTRTFAAREEVEVWTRRLSSAPTALQATPTASPPAGARATSELHDTRSTPPPISASKPRRGSRTRVGTAAVFAASALFVAIAFAFGPRVTTKAVAVSASVSRAASVPARPLSVEPALAPSSAEPAAAPSLDPPIQSRPHAGIKDANRPHPSAEPIEDREQLGILKLTADPRAVIDVSGPHFHRTGQSPMLALKVPAGRYEIVFRNDTWQPPLGAQVVVVAGVNRSVHADFRSAEPAISVR